jgi:phenylacetate-CoA ligase
MFLKALQRFHEAIKRRHMLDYRAFLEKSQWWSAEELREHQMEALGRLLSHAYENVPYWREAFQRLGLKPADFKSLDVLQKLPITDKSDIRANKERMIADNWRGRTWTKATGGSTGVPLELDYTPESYDWRVACSKRGYFWAQGCEDGKKQAYIWGAGIGKQTLLKKLKENLHHAILGQKYFNCFEFDNARMADCLAELRRYKPEYIVGYTNPLYEFAKFIEKSEGRHPEARRAEGSPSLGDSSARPDGRPRNDGKLAFRPKAVISAAEKLHPFQREVIERVFQCPAFNTYGSREFMLIGAECEKHEGLHVSLENLIVEIIGEDGAPAKLGEAGEIVITDLHNYGMPFIRYRIGDIGILSAKPCSCGRGLAMLKDVVGRSLDIIRTPDGRAVPGEFFPHLMKEFKGIEKFQVVQDRIDHLEVKVIKNSAFTDAEFRFMQNEIGKTIGTGVKVDYLFVNDIPLTRTGKFRVTVSEIK